MARLVWTALAVLIATVTQAAVTGDLKGVIVLHRHGARSPINPNPKTKGPWSALGYGLGELTKSGRAMHNAFGTLIRSTYVPSFLPNTISYADTYVRSSDVDRTLQSVQAIFQTLYPGATFPLHTIDVDYELLLQPTDKCASYHADAAIVRKQWDKAAGDQFSNDLAAIRQASGWGTDVSDSQVISWVVDNLECEQAQGMQSPQSLLDIRERMEAFQKDLSFAQFAPAADPDPRGVIASTLIQTISQNLQDVKAGKWPKFTVYSAHDTTIIGLMTSLGILPKRAVQWLPFFATSVTFELRVDNANNWYVNAFVGKPNATGADVETEAGWLYYRQPLGLNCPTPNEQCSLTDFAAYITKAVGNNLGCCVQSPGFFASRCDAYNTDFKQISQNCQIYRRLCPLTSCGSGQTLQSDTLNCLPSSSSQPDKDSWKTVGGIFIATSILLLLGILGFCWRRQVIPAPDENGGAYSKVPNV